MPEATGVTWQELRDEVGTSDAKQPQLEKCLAFAVVAVDRHIGSAEVPQPVRERAVLGVAVGEWNRKLAPSGTATSQFDSGAGVVSTPIRISRDPLAPAYRILAPYLIGLA